MQAIDHIINSAAKSNYMSAGQISVPIVFRGPNGAAAGVGAQHSQVHSLRFSLAPGDLFVTSFSLYDARGADLDHNIMTELYLTILIPLPLSYVLI